MEKEEPVLQKPDLTLVERACNGDTDSFTELCRRYYPAMVAIAHSVIGDRHLAEDAAQQTAASAVRKLPQLKNKDKFAAWLAAICRNVALDLARSRGMSEVRGQKSEVRGQKADGLFSVFCFLFLSGSLKQTVGLSKRSHFPAVL